MLETATNVSVSSVEQTPQIENQSPEKIEHQESFLSKMRSGIAQELKFTFTLPKPGKGLLNDLKLKGIGLSAVIVGGAIGEQVHAGNVRHIAGETPQQFHQAEQLLDLSGGMIAILGASTILIANRMRSQKIKDDAAFHERLKNDQLSR